MCSSNCALSSCKRFTFFLCHTDWLYTESLANILLWILTQQVSNLQPKIQRPHNWPPSYNAQTSEKTLPVPKTAPLKRSPCTFKVLRSIFLSYLLICIHPWIWKWILQLLVLHFTKTLLTLPLDFINKHLMLSSKWVQITSSGKFHTCTEAQL